MGKLVERSYFIRLLVSFLALATLTLISSSAIIYKNYKDEVVKEDSVISEQMLSQTVYGVDLIWDWASKHAIELYNNGYIFNAIYGNNISVMDVYNAEKVMSFAMSSNPFIYSVYIYNGNIGKMFSTISKGYFKKDFYDQDILHILEDKSLCSEYHFIPRTIHFKHYDKEYNEDVITLIVAGPVSDSKPLTGALILNIKVSTIRNLVKSMNTVSDDYFIIIDRNGKVVSHSQINMFQKDLSDEKYIKDIQKTSKNSGYFMENIDGKKFLVTYVASDKLKWRFIRLNAYDRLFENTHGLRNIIVIYSIFLFVFIAAVSMWLSWKFYIPIGGLIKMVNNNRGFLRREFLKNMMLGELHYYTDIDRKLEELNISLKLTDFSVAVLRVDNYWTGFVRENDKKDTTLLRFAISNIAHEIVSEFYTNEVVDMGDDVIAIVSSPYNEDIDTLQTNLCMLVQKIQKAVKEHLKIGLSGAIGGIAKELSDLPNIYKQAIEISDYRLVYGKEAVIVPDMVQANINGNYIYSEETEKEILDNLRLHNYACVEAKINSFFNNMKYLSYDDIMMSIYRLIHISIKTINDISGEKNYEYNYKFIRNKLEYMETLDEIRLWLLNIYRTFIEKGTVVTGNIKYRHIENIIEIVNKDYSNPNLSSDELAFRLGLTANYLREIFKELKSIPLSNYINEYRCKKAREMLLQTNMTISEISEKIGLTNQNYFFTLFKKYSGLTPVQFRTKNRGTDI